MKKLRLIELFAGKGAQARGIENLGIPFEQYKISEWDINAINAYKLIHTDDNTDYSNNISEVDLTDILYNYGISKDGKEPLSKEQINRYPLKWKKKIYNNFKATHNIGSICNIHGDDLEIVDTDKYTYLLTYSFPCTDLSLAGRQAGMDKGSGTRSGLLWEVERLLLETKEKPQILLMENVPQVHGKKNLSNFQNWIKSLELMGYKNWYQDLDAQDYGIPQHRNRCFMVSVLNTDKEYIFPNKIPLKYLLKDFLEEQVDDKYYLSTKSLSFFIQNDKKQKELGNGFKFSPIPNGENVAVTITTRSGSRMNDNFIAEHQSLKILGKIPAWGQRGRVIDETSVSATLTATDYKTPQLVAQKIKIKQCGNTYNADCITPARDNPQAGRVYLNDGLAPTLSTMQGGNLQPEILEKQTVLINNIPYMIINNEYYRIRKLTPKECFRLMGFNDIDVDKLKEDGMSDGALYKLAGNSIVTTVITEIVRQLINCGVLDY